MSCEIEYRRNCEIPQDEGPPKKGCIIIHTHSECGWFLVARFLSFRVETIISHHIKGKYFHSLRFHPAAVIHNSWHDKFMYETSRRTFYTWLNFDIHGHGNRSLYFTLTIIYFETWSTYGRTKGPDTSGVIVALAACPRWFWQTSQLP